MSESYEHETGWMGDPWDKLVVYFYMRSMMGWGIVGLSSREWFKAVLDKRYSMSLEVHGDAGGGNDEGGWIKIRKKTDRYHAGKVYKPEYKMVGKFYLWRHVFYPNREDAYIQYIDGMIKKSFWSDKKLSNRARIRYLKKVFNRYRETGEKLTIGWRSDFITMSPRELVEKVFRVSLERLDYVPLLDTLRVSRCIEHLTVSDVGLRTALVFLFFLLYEYSYDMSC